MAKKMVLLVEDEDTIASALEHMLTRKGYQCERVMDATDALSAIPKHSPNVVLLDAELSGCSGYEICQKIRSTPDLNRTKVVLMTARSGKVERQKCLAIGADDFFSKPFSITQIIRSVDTLTAGQVHG